MSPSDATYASPQIAKELTKVFGGRTSVLNVTMLASKDVSSFLRKLHAVNKMAKKSRLHFGG